MMRQVVQLKGVLKHHKYLGYVICRFQQEVKVHRRGRDDGAARVKQKHRYIKGALQQ
jgi:hypothetical protein